MRDMMGPVNTALEPKKATAAVADNWTAGLLESRRGRDGWNPRLFRGRGPLNRYALGDLKADDGPSVK
jgi:hypothetical protein